MNLLAKLGLLLLSCGTLAAYTAFFIVRRGSEAYSGPMPVITDMFREWPLAGSATAGIGSTMLLAGIQKSDTGGAKGLILVSSSMWLVIGSSRNFGDAVISWLHDLATLAFMLFGVYALAELEGKFWTWMQLVCLACAVSAVACGLALNIQKGIPGGKIGLGISEVLFVLALTFGFGRCLFFHGKAINKQPAVAGSSIFEI